MIPASVMAISSFLVETLASNLLNKSINEVLSKDEYEAELYKVINGTLKEFQKQHVIPRDGNNFPFYESEKIIQILLKQVLNVSFEPNKIIEELQSNSNIIPPTSEQIESFLSIFDSKCKLNEKLKDLYINKNYKNEIYKISSLLSEVLSKVKNTYDKEEKKKYRPFKTLPEWSQCKRETDFYENDKIHQIKSQLKDGTNDIRFFGLSGLGKTRIVQEVFINDDSSHKCLYCDLQCTEIKTLQAKLQDVFDDKNNEIIIIDNCDLISFRKVLKLKSDNNVENKIISIFNDPNDDNTSKIEDVDYIKLDINDLDSVVSDILKNKFADIGQTQLDIIKEFSEGIPLMAVLLAQNIIKGDRNLGNLSDKYLLDKLLSIESDDEKEILKSCSIFSFIGFDENFKDQIEFILSTKCITPADLGEDRMYKFQVVFNKYSKREIFEINGRYFGMRPKPLAFYLAKEWFAVCTKERFNELVLLLQDTSKLYTKSLTTALCNQIKYLGGNAKAEELIENITDYNGPFDSAKVLNTELGSRLFRSFVEVNPVAVADNLYRNFGSLTIEELKQIEEGRRNLIWTLEKLCFDARTFEKGAKLMMRFAIAENELCSNNSTGEFIRLFKLYLPGTEVNLYDRLRIIQWGFVQNECKELVIKAIASALAINGNAYFCGAETQGTKTLQHYYPKSKNEIRYYLSTLLNLIKEEIKLGNQFYDLCCHILANGVRGLYDFGVWEIIEPVIYEVIEIRNNDWEELLNSLYNIKSFVFKDGQSDKEEVIDMLIVKLTKTDFVSRFIETNKYRTRSYNNELSFADKMKEQNRLNAILAKEYVNKEELSLLILEKLYTIETSFNTVFGYTIAQEIKGDYQKNKFFVDNSILIFKKQDKFNPTIFVNYASGVTEDVKEYIVSVLQHEENLSYLLFPILVACKTNLDKTDILFELVKKKAVQVSTFQTYWESYLSDFSDDEISIFLNKILQLNAEAYITVLNMAKTLICFDSGMRYYKVEEIVETCIDNHGLSILKKDYYDLIRAILKNSNKTSFAKKINDLLIKLAGDRSTYYYGNSYLEILYSFLIKNYFDDIWDELSHALLSEGENYIAFYNLKLLLGSTVGNMSNSAGILFANGDVDKMFAWCKANSNIAPRRIIELVPVFEGNGFNPFVLKLLNEFGSDKDVLSALDSNMGSFFCSGSVVSLLECRINSLESIVNHPIITVSDWAKAQIECTKKEIKNELIREKETKLLYS